MRFVNLLVRVAVPVALFAASALGAGWKWESFLH
jgi:hypothetical protein